MKKVIFISALAIAAAVSCTKSDIVDTKFNEQIGFESYIGRAAQTKATVIDNGNIDEETIGLYGFYTGANPWKIGDEKDVAGAIDNPTPNLWDGDALAYDETKGWYTEESKYWTNASDYYSFLAYAPLATETNGLTATTTANPTVTYTDPVTVEGKGITDQIDLLYAVPVFNCQRGEDPTPKAVGLTMKHALSRIAIKAKEDHDDYTYTITGLSLSGTFVQEKTFSLVESKWVEDGAKTGATTYNFVVENNAVTIDKTVSADYVSCVGEEYLMIIPTAVTEAILTVTYKTTYGTDGNEVISAEIEKEVKISETFVQGKAYTINLTFEPNASEEIKFTVDVALWDEVKDGATVETPVDKTIEA